MHLTWNGIELHPNIETSDFSQVERKEVEKNRPIPIGVNGNHFPSNLFLGLFEDIEKICGFSTKTTTVVDNLALDFVLAEIYERHKTNLLLSLIDGRENLQEIIHNHVNAESDQPNGGSVIENDDENHVLSNQREIDVFILSLVKKESKLLLPKELCNLRGGAKISRRQSRKGRYVECRGASAV